METTTIWILAGLGGALIGLAAAMLLVFDGRIAGISGIIGGLVERPKSGEIGWRLMFVVGLLAGGAFIDLVYPTAIPESFPRSIPAVAIAGLLVGVGTRLGNGCTSGHGVCGIARTSMRSVVATVTFILSGAVVVTALRLLNLGGGV